MMNKIPIFFATWFGVGYLPKIPGTWASAAALPPAYLIVLWGGAYWLAISSGIIFVIGVWVSSRTASILEKSDPSEVVIDEIVGQWITLLFVPFSIYVYLAGFFLFRLFDIWKPWPIYLIDGKMKNGLGIMLDDVVAGIYAGTTLWGGCKVYSFLFGV